MLPSGVINAIAQFVTLTRWRQIEFESDVEREAVTDPALVVRNTVIPIKLNGFQQDTIRHLVKLHTHDRLL